MNPTAPPLEHEQDEVHEDANGNGVPLLDPNCIPSLDHLVTQDDSPVDNFIVERLQRLLTEPLYSSWGGPGEGRPFVAAANVGLFAEPKNPAFVPDFLLSLDVKLREGDPRAKENHSYYIWLFGKPPDPILEIVSDRRPPKQFPGNNPAPARAVKGEHALLATGAAIHGGEIAFEGKPFDNIGTWHGKDDHVAWTVEVEKAGEYDVWLDWACADESAGNAYMLEGGKARLRGKVKATGGWDKYKQEKIGTIMLAAGTQRLTLRPDGELRRALLDLRGLHLVAPGQQPTHTEWR
jgi:hypothetical protein